MEIIQIYDLEADRKRLMGSVEGGKDGDMKGARP